MSRKAGVGLAVVVAFALIAWWLWPRPPAPATTTAPAPVTRTGRARPQPARWGRLDPPRAEVRDAADAEHGSIGGNVVDWATQDPVAGAELTFMDTEGVASAVVTDDDGGFVFVAPAAGTFVLQSVLAEGYLPYAPELGLGTIRFEARPDRHVDGVEIVLVPRSTLRGLVLDAEGEPVASAAVVVLGIGAGDAALGDVPDRFTSDAEGRFEFVATVDTWLQASHPQHGVGHARVDPSAAVGHAVVIRLDPHTPAAQQSIGGKVIDPQGAGIEGARVIASGPGLGPGSEAVTGPDGAFDIEDLKPGAYRVEARHPGYAPVWARGIESGSDGLTLQLGPGGGIEGTIAGPDGAAVAGAAVVVLRHAGPLARTQQAQVTTFDVDGHYAIDGLPPGRYDVIGAASGWAYARVDGVDVGTGRALVDLRLSAGALVHGRVLDDAGGPVADARVEIERGVAPGSPVAPLRSLTVTAADGVFEIEGVEPGRHSLGAYAAGFDPRTVSGVDVPGVDDVGPIEIALARSDGSGIPRYDIVGIGAMARASGDALEVAELVESGGGEQAGLAKGDLIIAIDGVAVSGLGFEGGIEGLRGIEGTVVVLTIVRAGGRPFDVTVVRSRVRG